jgi:hypothetical protein
MNGRSSIFDLSNQAIKFAYYWGDGNFFGRHAPLVSRVRDNRINVMGSHFYSNV